MSMSNIVYLLFSLLWLLYDIPRALSQPELTSFCPRSGPTWGGTNISVWGSGFEVTTRCNFANLPAASIPSLTSIVHNSTFMTCILPELTTDFQFPENSTHNIIQFRIVTSSSEQSDEEDFTVFNLTNILVTSLSPSIGFISPLDNHVQFSGNNFVNTSELYCFIGDLCEPAVFIDNETVTCNLPSYPIASRQYPLLSLNGDFTGFVPVLNNSNEFVFYSTAPTLEMVEFSSSAAQLVLTFDQEVELGRENFTSETQSFECSEIFDSNTTVLLGEAAQCGWQTSQQRVVIIQLHGDSLILPSHAVTLSGASIRTRAVEYSMLSSDSKLIPNPAGPIPVAVLEAPGAIPACGLLNLVARNSLYGGGRPMAYEWSGFTGNQTLNEFISDNDRSFIAIPVQSLANTGPYNFTVTVTNFLGLQNATTVSYSGRPSSDAIVVTIYGNHMRSFLVDSDNIVIETKVDITSCSTTAANGGMLEYSWTVTDSNGTAITLGSSAMNNQELWIPPLVLQPGITYEIQVSVSYSDQPSAIAGTAAIQVTGLHPAIIAAIQTGHKSSVRITEPVYLDTSPSRGILPDQTYQYQWQCGSCRSLPDSISFSSSSFTLPANSLPLGSYNFTVTITHSVTDLASTAFSMVEVIAAQTDQGEITPSVKLSPSPKWNSLSANDKTIVKGTVSVPSDATVEWTTVEVKSLGYDHQPIDDTFTNTPKSYSALSSDRLTTLGEDVKLSSVLVASSSETEVINEVSLTVNPNALKSGVSYRIRLNATTLDGYSVTAELDVTTVSQPTSGGLLVTPNEGMAFNTLFTITAMDWMDNFGDPPLFYQFGFRLTQQSTKVYWLSSIKSNSQILSYLPIVPINSNSASINSNTVVVLRVYNRLGAFAVYEMSFNGTTAANERYDASSFVRPIREQVTQYGQLIEGLASLTAIVASVNEYSSRFTNIAAFRSEAVDFLLDVSNQVNPTKSSLNQILFLLEYASNGMTFSVATQERLVAFLERIVQAYQMFQSNFVFSTPGFNADEASAVFTLYGRMLGGAAVRLQSNEISSSYLSVIYDLSYGICRQLGLNEEVTVAERTFGSLRLSYYTPANQFAASCISSDGNDDCPFSQHNAIDIDFSTALFNRYISWECEDGHTCSGVCLMSVQLLRNILWDGNPYLWHSKASSLSLYVINPRDGRIELVEGLATPVELQFPVVVSNSTSECVFWSVREGGWSTRGCGITVEGSRVICSCNHFSEFTVLAVCPSGYYGDQCQFTCPSNMLYGEQCINECACSVNGNCSPVDGSCDCNPGYTGSTCSSECDESYYGKNCLQQCQCVNAGSCDHIDGTCYCTDGWIGERCATRCPQGKYGRDCAEDCVCRSVKECNHVTGLCSCQPGYTGDDCLQACPEPLYGDGCQRNCTSQCDVTGTARMECHHVEGPNCTCNPGYIGKLCQTIEMLPSPSPPVPTEKSELPVAVLAVIPVILFLLILTIIVIILVQWRWKKHRSGKAKVAPIDEVDMELATKKSIFDGEPGIHLTRVESFKILSKMNSANDNYHDDNDSVHITRTHSLTVIVPAGAKLQDMFSESQQGATCSFKEPPEHGGKFRWQIIHLKEKNTTDKPTKMISDDDKFGSKELLVHKDNGDDEELALKQVRYHQGVYVDPNATLREVRDLFLETGQLELDMVLFQFLDPNSHSRLFSIEEEDAITLDSMELKLPRTLFIKSIPDSKGARLDFCLCGRVADFECTDCNARGYCSVECQQEDWHKHMVTCKKQRKKKKKSKKNKKKDPYRLHSPDPNTCVCGAPAEMECSQCGNQGYCSEECQLVDWEEHQLYCEPRPSSKPATPTNNSSEEIPAKDPDTASVDAGSVASVTTDPNDKLASDTGPGSHDSLLDDKV